jgi:ATP-dependent protease ClpP protease subunit
MAILAVYAVLCGMAALLYTVVLRIDKKTLTRAAQVSVLVSLAIDDQEYSVSLYFDYFVDDIFDKVFSPLRGVACLLMINYFLFATIAVYAVVLISPHVVSSLQKCVLRRVCCRIAPGVTWRNTLTIRGEITPKTATTVIRVLRYAAPGEPVVLVVDSGGGDAASARTIIRAIRSYEGYVRVIVGRKCMSSAFNIACAVPTKDRHGIKESTILIHGCKTGAPRETTSTTHESDQWFTNLVTQPDGSVCLEKANDWCADHLAAATQLDKTMLSAVMSSGGDLVFDAQAALKNGLIGSIVQI